MIDFFVPGVPATAGSKRGFINPRTGGIIITDDTGQRGKNWRVAVQDAARGVYTGPPFPGPLVLLIEFRVLRPKGHFRADGGLKPGSPRRPVTRPDATKMLRAVEDALTKILWRDDSQVVHLAAEKVYAEAPGARVRVWSAT